MHSALLWLFDDPANVGWTQRTGGMAGNGFAWGQLSHLLAFVFQAAAVGSAAGSGRAPHSRSPSPLFR